MISPLQAAARPVAGYMLVFPCREQDKHFAREHCYKARRALIGEWVALFWPGFVLRCIQHLSVGA
jgi:hypothetical protein